MLRKKDYFRVSLQVSREHFAFAEAMAARHGYFGPADYLNAVLNMAMIAEPEQLPLSLPVIADDDCRAIEDAGGGIRAVADIDDDIPF